MSKLLLLLKVDLIRTFQINKLKNNKNIFKTIGIILLVLFIMTSVCSSVSSYTYLGIKFLMQYGLEKYLFLIIYCLCGFAIFYATIYRSKSYLFNSEDNIFAMPIKPSIILTSRVIVLIILNYLVTTFVCLPAFITYGIMLKMGIIYYVYACLAYIFIPFFPTILGCIFGYIIGYFTSKVNNKKMFETILTFGTVLLIMLISFNIKTVALKFVNNIDIVNRLLDSIGFLVNSFMKLILEYSLKDLLIYIFTNIALVVLFIIIFKNSYVKIVQNLKVEGTKKKYIEKEHISKSPLVTLILKEFKMYLSIPIYILNTSFGVILILFASVATLFYDKEFIFKIMKLDPGSLPLYVLLIPVIAFSMATSNTAACSISIEGKNFWILKTMPIKTLNIFLSKIILNMLVVIPLTVITIIIFGISFKLTIIQVLTVILLAIVTNIACSMFGIIINLKYPRLDFVSYTHVVKQSLSSFLGVMGPLVLFFALGTLYTALHITIDTYILIIFALLLCIIMLQYYILKRWGIKRFNDIN